MDETVKPAPRGSRSGGVARGSKPATGVGAAMVGSKITQATTPHGRTGRNKAGQAGADGRTARGARAPRRSAVEAWRVARAARKQARLDRLAAQKAEQDGVH